MRQASSRVMFLYWGRRGLTRLVQDLAGVGLASPSIDASISISRQNERFADFLALADRIVPVNTFSTNAGALGQSWRIPLLRRQLVREVTERRIEAVIELMPHVWSSLVLPAVKAKGVRYATIVHDAATHPGDYRSLSIQGLVQRSIRQADVVLTLSEMVASRLLAAGVVPRERLGTLFHPDLSYGGATLHTLPQPSEPFRLAFLGRIMPYKGLPMFVETIEMLRAEGLNVAAGVFGEGSLGKSGDRLAAMGAEIVNRWLGEAEINSILSRYHALMLSHIEASQSGVAATALGAGLPVVATPVGGLVEQVHDGVTGVLAVRADAPALKEAAKRLIQDPQLYASITLNLSTRDQTRSISRFVEECVGYALGEPITGR